jgi:hypothetical protein
MQVEGAEVYKLHLHLKTEAQAAQVAVAEVLIMVTAQVKVQHQVQQILVVAEAVQPMVVADLIKVVQVVQALSF